MHSVFYLKFLNIEPFNKDKTLKFGKMDILQSLLKNTLIGI